MARTAGRLKYFCLAYLSQPATDRPLFRAIRKGRFQNIVELGIGNGRRAMRMISVARSTPGVSLVRYTAVDLFELRSGSSIPPLSLKQAYCLLRPAGAQLQIVPGDPLTALARAANGLPNTDLVVISADQPPAALAKAWFYLPRMLHAGSKVFLQQPGTKKGPGIMRPVPHEEINRLAAAATTTRRAA